MTEEPTNTMFELFTCINCNTIKQCSYILGCFHVICGDCSENAKSNLKECCVLPRNPHELVPHPLTKQYAQQLQSLYEIHSGRTEDKLCVICQDMEGGNKDMLFCVQCASFWCRTHLSIHHRAMLKGSEHPFFQLDKDIELKELFRGLQGSVEANERENYFVNQFIQKCEEVINEGQMHQKTLTELNSTVDIWKEKVTDDLKGRFTVIREKLDELETEANNTIENKCRETKERLDLCFRENESKLRNMYRGINLMLYIKNFSPNNASEILNKLTVDKIKEKSMTSFITFLLEMVPNISKLNRDLESETNQIIIEARVIEPEFTYVDFKPDKQLYEGQELTVTIQTCDKFDIPAFSTNSVIEMEINKMKGKIFTSYERATLKNIHYEKKSQGYPHKLSVLEASNYQIKLLVNNSKVARTWNFTVIRDFQSIKEPTISKLTVKGEAKSIAIHRNIIYVATPSLKEIEIYSIDGGFHTKDKCESSSLTSPRFEESARSQLFTPRFEGLNPKCFSLDSAQIDSFPNPKYGVNYEETIGRGMLSGPHGICCYEDYIYVSDKVLHTILCFTNIGAFIQKFGIHGNKVGEFSSPHGIAINKSQKLLVVADRYNDRVQLMDLNSGSMMAVGTSDKYTLKQPLDVAITMDDFYIVSTFKNDILFYDNNFQWLSVIMADIENPFHMTIDHTNQLYISSYTGGKIYTILPLPQPLHGFNIQEVEIKGGEFPSGVAVGEDGTLYAVCHNTTETPFEQLLFGW